jgi:hypothetical protein
VRFHSIRQCSSINPTQERGRRLYRNVAKRIEREATGIAGYDDFGAAVDRKSEEFVVLWVAAGYDAADDGYRTREVEQCPQQRKKIRPGYVAFLQSFRSERH